MAIFPVLKAAKYCHTNHHSFWTITSLFTTRGRVSVCGCACVWSALHTVHILPSKSWPVFSSRADMPGLPGVHTRRRAPPHLAPAISESSADSATSGTKHQLTCPVVTCWPQAACRLSAYCLNSLSALFRFSLLSFLALALKDLFRTQHAQTVAQFSITCNELPGWVLLMLLHAAVMVHEPRGFHF